MKQKKFLALGMATVMAFSSTVMTLADDVTDASDAADKTISGAGSLEGYVDKDKFTVTLPTTDSVDFTLDPQELILAVATSAPKLDTADGSLTTGYGSKILFKSATSGVDYASKSKDITVVNKSTFDVDVSVNAKLTGLSSTADGYDIKALGKDDAFGTATAIKMALSVSENTITDTTESTAVAKDDYTTYLTDSTSGVTVTYNLAKAGSVADAYKVTKTGDTYSYDLDATKAKTVAFNEAVFNLSGEVNTAADWTKFNAASDKTLGVTVTYSVKKHVDSYTSTTSVSASNLTIKFDSLPEGTSFSSLSVVNGDNNAVSWTAGNQYKYTASTNTITITSTGPVNNNKGGTITIKYTDGHTDTISIE